MKGKASKGKPVMGHNPPGEHKNSAASVNANNVGAIPARPIEQVPSNPGMPSSRSPMVSKKSKAR